MQKSDRSLSIPKDTIHTLLGVSAFHYDFNWEQVSERWAWSGYMVSGTGDNQHCEVEVAASFLYEDEQTDVVFQVVALCVAAAEREP